MSWQRIGHDRVTFTLTTYGIDAMYKVDEIENLLYSRDNSSVLYGGLNVKEIKKEDIYLYVWPSLVAQIVKNPPAMQKVQEMQAQSLSWKVSLKVGMATHSSILAWRIPVMAEPGGLPSMGSHRVRHN